ncbi:PREDICTED: uncharacterized protein LOC109168311 [Ipomoea nil]|uniref:uncharacterized protein LOC109168311 n=1 Tax=Ipomoea nil TaxID=35883 RepID=UPI000901665F|nr:PREDICTED: uncharacterized protein LOC109168311 [Ipomoea nil]
MPSPRNEGNSYEPKCTEELETRNIALVAIQQPATTSRSNSNPFEYLSDEKFALFVRKFKRFMRKNNFQEFQASPNSSSRKYTERSTHTKKQEPEEAQVLCYNCRKPGHFKENCPHPMVRRHHNQEPSTSSPNDRKDVTETSRRNAKHETNQSRNDRRRKAMVVNETNEVVEPELSTSNSSSESESSEDEKGLLCLYSQKESDDNLCLMAKDNEVDSQSSSFTQIESSLESEEGSVDSVKKLMRDFKVVKNTYSKIKEENS